MKQLWIFIVTILLPKILNQTAAVMPILYTCTWIPVLDNAGVKDASYRIIFYFIKGDASNFDPEKNTKCTLWKESRILKVN
jgi:hypothetical protein